MSIFIEWPWLALAPAAVFLGCYRVVRRKLVATAGGIWIAYALYEYGMQRRWLCSGECNIRVDLLLLYPLLVAVSVFASIVIVRSVAGRKPSSAR